MTDVNEDSEDPPRPTTAADLRISVLGPVSVTHDGTAVPIGGPKQRTVLAVLAAHCGSPVSADSLIDAVWGDEAVDRASRTLQTYVSTLRSVLDGCIERAGRGWCLRLDPAQIDANRFVALYEHARDDLAEDPQAAGEMLREALALWVGHPYSEIEPHGALDGEVARLVELRAAAKAARIDADLAVGRHAELIGELEALMAESPYSERFRAQHMVALYRAGRQQEALRSYADIRTRLVDELGVEPGPDLQNLERRILEQDESLDAPVERSVQARAVLVADHGDPFAIGHLPAAERDELLARASTAFTAALDDAARANTHAVGLTTYTIFDSPRAATEAARRAIGFPGGERLRYAIDWGDVIVDGEGVAGAPVVRAATLAAAAHEGQIVLSRDAQRVIADTGSDAGMRFAALGAHELRGIEDEVVVYQLLVDGGRSEFPPLDAGRTPPPLPEQALRSLPGYELREPFVRGSIGMIHRAFQPTVGREVLIEVIDRHDAAELSFVRSFEADAQRLSVLDHQNIEAVIDHWRRPDGAYLVYRRPRGGVLSAPEVPVDARRVIDQVGAGLAFAHSVGLVHGSLRPESVVLDEAGNASLIGFPIAGVAPVTSGAYPAYLAPELINGGAIDERTDVYALGVLCQDLLAGPVRVDEPVTSAHPAIERALATDPDDRFATVVELMTALNPAGDAAPATRYTRTRNPYKGLAAFQEADSADFHGRDAAIRELTDALADNDLVTVVGPSGVGKSSVVRAGLVPAIRAGAIPGSQDWVVTDMVPGSHPFAELGRALERVVTDMPVELRSRLAASSPDVLEAASAVLPGGSELLLVVDQAEELFTMTSERDRAAFLAMVVSAIRDRHARFVLTLRADFLDGPLRHAEFAELVRHSAVLLRSPTASELEEAIVAPARRLGVEVDSGLAQRMVSELVDQPGALPLLQHALGQMFEQRDSDLIDAEAFERIGGVTGSLAQSAEQLYGSLDTDEREAVKQAFLRLVTVDEQGRPTRNRVRTTALADLGAGDALDQFARRRLVVMDADANTREPTVEVAHEALLSHWPRLAGWIDSTRGDLVLAHRLDQAISDWHESGRDDAYLLGGGRLAQHQAWTSSTSLALTAAQREILAASTDHERLLVARRRRVRVATSAILAVITLLASAFGVLAVRAARTATDKEELARARELAASAISVTDEDPQLAMLLAIEAIETAPEGEGVFAEGMLSLREAVNANRLLDRVELPLANGAEVLPDGSGVIITEGEARRVSLHAIVDGRIEREPEWDYEDLTTIDFMRGAHVHPGGEFVVVTLADEPNPAEPGADVPADGEDRSGSRLLVLDLGSGLLERTVEPPPCHSVAVFIGRPWFSSDGSLFAFATEATPCAEEPGWVGTNLYETGSWSPVAVWPYAEASMTADMSTIAVSSVPGGPAAPGGVEILSYPSLELERVLDVPPEGPRLITADGRFITVLTRAAEDTRPSFWDAQTGALVSRADDHEGFAGEAISVAGGLVSLSGSGGDGLWDPATGRRVVRHSPSFNLDASVTADGRLKATATPGTGVQLWDLGVERGEGTSLTEQAGFVWLNPDPIRRGPNLALWGFVTFAPDRRGERIAVVDPEVGSVTAALDATAGFDQLPDGRLVVVPVDEDASTIGPLSVWDPRSGAMTAIQDCVAPLDDYAPRNPDGSLGHDIGYICPDGELLFGAETVVSSDGSTFAAVAFDPRTAPVAQGSPSGLRLRTWDAATLEVVSTVDIGIERSLGLNGLAASGEGWVALIEVAGPPARSELRVIDVVTGADIARLPGLWDRTIVDVSPDGLSLYLGSSDGTVAEFDTQTWQLTRSWPANVGRQRGVGISADGKLLAVGGEDERVSIWRLDDADPVLVDRIPTGGWASDVTFLDGDTIGVAVRIAPGNTAWRTFELDSEAVVRAAREEVVRSFTAEECTTYAIDPCPTQS